MPGSLTDVAGIRVGHTTRRGRGWLTGATVVCCPPDTVGAVDVRGGAPGTRETDLLRPGNLVQHVDAVCLTGGSAFGLAAADGVMQFLAQRDLGFRVGPQPHQVVPIVPAAVIFDLGRGGAWGRTPDAHDGRRATARASVRPPAEGSVGAGTGARAGGLKGGVGTASCTLADGTVVAALAVVNAAGSVFDPATGLPWVPVPALGLRRPPAAQRRALGEALTPAPPAANTTIGVVATDARLSRSELVRLATGAHDGIARAVRPAHLMNDGDTVFALATGGAGHEGGDSAGLAAPAVRRLNQLVAAAADVFAEAATRAVVLATGAPGLLAYRDLCPGAWPAHGLGE